MKRLLQQSHKCIPLFVFGLVAQLPVSYAQSEPFLITSRRGLVNVDGNYVYLTRGLNEFCTPPAGGAVFRVSVNGGTLETLYSSCEFNPAAGVSIGVGHLFVGDSYNSYGERIVRIPITGGTPTTIASAPGLIFHRAFNSDADFVYWADDQGVKRAYKTGGGTQILVPRGQYDSYRGLSVDDVYLYYLCRGCPSRHHYEIRRLPKGGGTVETLYRSAAFEGIPDAAGPAIDDAFIYWFDPEVSGGPASLMKMSKGPNANPITIYTEPYSRRTDGWYPWANLFFFAEHEYPFNVESTTGKIRYIDKAGGPITDLVIGLTSPSGPMTDGRYVYWSDDNGRVGGTSGTKRVNLPPVDNDGDGVLNTIDCDDNNPNITTGNTCVSELPVTVQSSSGKVTVTYPTVTGGGDTTIIESECTPGAVRGITLVPTAPLCADIATTATFSAPVKVCMEYDDTGLTPPQEANLQMVRCHPICELLACSPPEPVDTVNNIVCGCTTGFSKFAIGTPMDSDGDFVPDLLDNCPNTYNPFQEDANNNGIGDACEET